MSGRGLRAQYINLFLLCNDIDVIKRLTEALNRLCINEICKYTVLPSKIVDRFFYIKISPLRIENLEEVKKWLLSVIEEYRGFVSWYKIETVEVK